MNDSLLQWQVGGVIKNQFRNKINISQSSFRISSQICLQLADNENVSED